MTGASSTSTCRAAPTPFEPLSRSVYIGRQYLGRYKQTEPDKFEAFAANGRSLGVFKSAAATLAAIDPGENRS
jgi:hypothetical protein